LLDNDQTINHIKRPQLFLDKNCGRFLNWNWNAGGSPAQHWNADILSAQTIKTTTIMAEETQNQDQEQKKEELDSLLKKILYQGVAKASEAIDYVSKTVSGLVGENKISNEEGKNIVNNFKTNIDTKVKDMETRLRETISSALQNVRPASKSEVEELRKRVEALEKIVAGLD
jgi:polyhydroxyalkanoate synthesis regulator phasin